jgi:sugar/nucleoside kinase (ribokinase family)
MWLGRVLPMVDLFLPSLDEISFMLGREASQTDTDVLDFVAGELLGMGPAVIGLKLGDRGLYLRTSSDSQRLGRAAALPVGKHWLDRQLLAPCFAVEVAGTTGSGDCTIAGFLAAILNGLAPEAALNHAVGVGAFCVERPDATSGVPSWKRLEDRLSGPWPRRAVKLAMTGWTWSETSAVWVGPRDPLKEA